MNNSEISSNSLRDKEKQRSMDVADTSAESTPDGSAKWNRLIQVVSCLAFALGCVWILLFPMVTVTTGEAKPRGTFFDENAMLVHHTTLKLKASDIDWAQPRRLREDYLEDDNVGGAAWVCKVLREMDLPCYTHVFSTTPGARTAPRTSVYTVLEPSPGADGKECMVLTTAQNLSGPAEQMLAQPELAGLSMSLSILKQLKDHVGWMSKRLIVLIADEDPRGPWAERLHVGVKSFVDDYHADTLRLLDRQHEDPKMTSSVRRAGVVRAAISLDFPVSGDSEAVQLLTSGVNGELPNMDLLNSAVYHHERQGIRVMLDTCTARLDRGVLGCSGAPGKVAQAAKDFFGRFATGRALPRYLDRLIAMLGFMGSVAMGPSGPHAHFLRHSVDALTIKGLAEEERSRQDSTSQPTVSEVAVHSTTAVLNIVRGISNLEEELHHSFFSYLMMSTTAFVSIGEYAYTLALFLVPLALQGRHLTRLYVERKLFRAVLIVSIFHAFGALVLWLSSAWPEPSEQVLGVSLVVLDLVGYLLILGIHAYFCRQDTQSRQLAIWEGPRAVMSCLLAYSCSVTALLSWQVAAVVAMTHVPLLIIVCPLERKSVFSWCTVFAMLVTSPACWSLLVGYLTHTSRMGTILGWLRWFRLSGLFNVPLMCMVLMPVHLTIALVMAAPHTEVNL